MTVSEETVSYTVTPSGMSGKIEFVTSYMSEGDEIIFVESVDVAVSTRKPEEKQSIAATVFAVVADPKFYISASLLSAFLTMLLLRHSIMRGIASIRNTRFKAHNRFAPSMYEKWEMKQRRR